ncbi:MAG TPA: peptidylprolyl isomerase [Acidimicrobiaceae bacterium]|nr:peptidylprolyl isomerase [Acidimicrobiaceae bacterium]
MHRVPRRFLTPAVVLAFVLVACGDDEATSDTTQALVVADPGEPLPDGCAAADGSSPQTKSFTEYPPICLRDGMAYTATIDTNLGTLHIDLYADTAPLTVNSFVNLARYRYFDGTTCHRAIQEFVVQCGDPTATGSGGPGYEFADETAGQAPYRIGSVAMANAGPNTNGSQFFLITGNDGAALPANYTLFGQVIDDDLGVLEQLDMVANPGDGPPLQPINILAIRIEER